MTVEVMDLIVQQPMSFGGEGGPSKDFRRRVEQEYLHGFGTFQVQCRGLSTSEPQ